MQDRVGDVAGEGKAQPVRGRPKWMPDDGVITAVERLASRGLTKQIASCLGISYDTFNERAKELSDFSEAIKKGRAKAIYDVANALYQSAMSGNVTAMIFWLKSRAGWRDVPVDGGYDQVGTMFSTEAHLSKADELVSQRIAEIMEKVKNI